MFKSQLLTQGQIHSRKSHVVACAITKLLRYRVLAISNSYIDNYSPKTYPLNQRRVITRRQLTKHIFIERNKH